MNIVVSFILRLGGVSFGCLDFFSLDVFFIGVTN